MGLDNAMPNSPSSPIAHGTYVGRFAPSPTGPLHFGSLLAAVASYLDARAHNGRWLLRMEDLDPPREPAGAADQILQQLTAFGLHWDGEVLYQSSRLADYAEVLQQLQRDDHCFYCTCTRPDLRAMGFVYDGRCRQRTDAPTTRSAVRVKTMDVDIAINDGILGIYRQNIETDCGDFIIRRKDGLFAYQLAVVVDDAHQGITHVIRGADLLDSTPRQVYLQRLLGYHTPQYAHVPLIVDRRGEKLSKQSFAPALATGEAQSLIHSALQLLGQQPPERDEFASHESLLQWAIANWDIQAVPKLATIPQAPQR